MARIALPMVFHHAFPLPASASPPSPRGADASLPWQSASPWPGISPATPSRPQTASKKSCAGSPTASPAQPTPPAPVPAPASASPRNSPRWPASLPVRSGRAPSSAPCARTGTVASSGGPAPGCPQYAPARCRRCTRRETIPCRYTPSAGSPAPPSRPGCASPVE